MLFPDKMDLLIKTTEKPVKKSLEQLAADLKRLGVTVEESGDVGGDQSSGHGGG